MEGKDYCLSAKDAMNLILRNPASFASVHSFGTLYTLMGVTLIGATVGFSGYSFMQSFAPETNHLLFTACVMTAIGVFIGSGFLSILS